MGEDGLGASGAAAAMLITEAGFAVVLLAWCARSIGGLGWVPALGPPALAGAAAAVLMAAIPLDFGLALAAGLVVYLVAVAVLESALNPDAARLTPRLVARLPRYDQAR